jgi:proline-specific peptidase
MDKFVREIAAVRDALDLKEIHLLGHSWGGSLALEYMLTKPDGVRSLILASTLSDSLQWILEARRLLAELPGDCLAVAARNEAASTFDSQEFQMLNDVFRRNYILRLDVLPECFKRSVKGSSDLVYRTMWGPSEFSLTGKLKNWSVTHRLNEICVPTLITHGRFDESTHKINRIMEERIPHAQTIVFSKSSHCPHLEEPQKYIEAIERFIGSIDSIKRSEQAFLV